MKKYIYPLLLCTLLASCAKNVSNQQEVYFNDFEANNLLNITSGSIETYNGTHVLGRYNNGGFDLKLNDLPKHKLIEISFDLYIHDSWDGNKTGKGIDGPDIWKLMVDGNVYINTTFANVDCAGADFCPTQSYPQDYPNFNHNAKSGASNPNLPGVCSLKGKPGGTSLYKITRTIEHTNSSLLMQCRDQLLQTNASDPKCDESWSVDNIRIKAINL